ncbi:c-type cytochrome [Puniceicoccaceae bacterium K14]|nr:c-type cytochrome [Puniceicoccaceae bacterium K14]
MAVPYLKTALTLYLISISVSAQPILKEEGMQLSLFAENPDIVTPVGMAIDNQDRIFVIESHTHIPPSDYQGPERDLIKVFYDDDNDGKAERVEVFAEGLNMAMNLAFSPEGTLYAICAHEVVALPDRDGDMKCDRIESVLKLETSSMNPHGGWLGIAFDPNGKMYLTRGNLGAAYHIVTGKDGSHVEGFGDGGDVIRADADGTNVEPWATGFWNPFDITFDHTGKLMLIDNDPDARGPNRLLEVVEGGDYGYKAIFGGGGNHPFQSWNGEIPGTLPFLSGTGEAPSGLIDVSTKNVTSYLITIWNENTIERHTIRNGIPEKTLLMKGDQNFRPVSIKQDSKGNLYVTDWVLVDYPNHGKGRIWRIANGAPKIDYEFTQHSRTSPTTSTIAQFLKSPDPFKRHYGSMWLARPEQTVLALELSQSEEAAIRLGVFIALRRYPPSSIFQYITQTLNDPDPSVRQFGLMWAAESRQLELRTELDAALLAGEVTASVFESYLAAVEMINPLFINEFENIQDKKATQIPRKLEPGLIEKLATDSNLPFDIRALAVGKLKPEIAFTLLENKSTAIRLAAIKNVQKSEIDGLPEKLISFALNETEPISIRIESVFYLSLQNQILPKQLVILLQHSNDSLALESARTLGKYAGDPKIRKALESIYHAGISDPTKYAITESIERSLFGFDPTRPFASKRPNTIESWKAINNEGGDPDRGSRVFRGPQNMCINCHSMDSATSLLGPNLRGLADSMSREQIAHSILKPSDSLSPEFQAWGVRTRDGKLHQGVQIDHVWGTKDITLYTTNRKNERFEENDILSYEALPHSLMPAGLENLMTVSEFKDLIAYLSSKTSDAN